MADTTQSKLSLQDLWQGTDALQESFEMAQRRHDLEMTELRRLFTQFLSTARPPDALDPLGSRTSSAQSIQAQREAQRDAEMSELRKAFAHYMSSRRPPDIYNTFGSQVDHHPFDKMSKPMDDEKVEFCNEDSDNVDSNKDDDASGDDLEVVMMIPSLVQTDLGVLNVKEVPLVAWKVECSAEFSREAGDSIQLQSLLAGNSPFDQAMILTRDLGNVPVVAYACDEPLSFDPGGESIIPCVDALDCLLLYDELNRGSVLLVSEPNCYMKILSRYMGPEMRPDKATYGFSSEISGTSVNRKYEVHCDLLDKTDELAAILGEVLIVEGMVHELGAQQSAMVSKDQQPQDYTTLTAYQVKVEVKQEVPKISKVQSTQMMTYDNDKLAKQVWRIDFASDQSEKHAQVEKQDEPIDFIESHLIFDLGIEYKGAWSLGGGFLNLKVARGLQFSDREAD